ncbi:MAG: pentapeptide repeat-containing protein [Alphaproteobacteria bacterium]|nr:pentapeptide repeat-containing protein [Alphaproteobacteria bacterium]MBT7744746.1 pentapeptide repeat-containing protein [Alphaproteobacteria bacterium]
MTDSENQALSQKELLGLAREGSDIWNAWAKENPRAIVDFSDVNFTLVENKAISFQDFVFPGEVSFHRSQFELADFDDTKFLSGKVSFEEVRFDGNTTWFRKSQFDGELVNFESAQFGGDVFFGQAKFSNVGSFIDVEFKGYAGFGGVHFAEEAVFSGAKFHSTVLMEGASFGSVPDFRRTNITSHFTLHDISIAQPKNSHQFSFFSKRVIEGNVADKYRRLKELAVLAKDHDREQEFFAEEIKAKRIYETKGVALVWSYLYEWCSDFGRSTYRPFALLFWTWFVCGIGYFLAAGVIAGSPDKSLLDGFRLSAATLVPFVAVSKSALATAQENLFENGVPFWIDAAAFLEGIFGLAFVFLIGLALRNRFRI